MEQTTSTPRSVTSDGLKEELVFRFLRGDNIRKLKADVARLEEVIENRKGRIAALEARTPIPEDVWLKSRDFLSAATLTYEPEIHIAADELKPLIPEGWWQSFIDAEVKLLVSQSRFNQDTWEEYVGVWKASTNAEIGRINTKLQEAVAVKESTTERIAQLEMIKEKMTQAGLTACVSVINNGN